MKKSFTLIELLVVIAIIGLLSSIVYVSLSGVREKAQRAKAVSYASQVHRALGAYMVGYWDFNSDCNAEGETPAQINDLSGYRNHGTNNGSFCSTNTPFDLIGQGSDKYSLQFNGVDNYVDIDNFISLFASAGNTWTVEAWFKWPESPVTRGTGNSSHTIIGKAGGIGGSATFNIYNGINTYNDTEENYTNVSLRGVNSVVSPNAVNDGKWHHVVIMWDGADAKMYFDGNYEGDASVGIASEQTMNVYIGTTANASVDHMYEGNINDVRIYNRVLESAEIQSLYYAGLKNYYK